MRKLFIAVPAMVVAYIAFMGAALAGTAIPADDAGILDFLTPVYEAIKGGAYWPAAMFGLIFVVTAVKRYTPSKFKPYVNGPYGQPLTVLLVSFASAAITGMASAGTSALTLGLAWAAIKVAAAAVGGYELLKQLLAPLIIKLGSKAPSWMKPAFDLLLWVFSKPSAVEKAEKAGDDAVAANPPTGADKNDIAEI